MPELREDIKSALQSLISQPLREASLALLATLGYRSDRTLVLEGSKPQAFLDLIESQGGATKFDSEKASFVAIRTDRDEAGCLGGSCPTATR